MVLIQKKNYQTLPSSFGVTPTLQFLMEVTARCSLFVCVPGSHQFHFHALHESRWASLEDPEMPCTGTGTPHICEFTDNCLSIWSRHFHLYMSISTWIFYTILCPLEYSFTDYVFLCLSDVEVATPKNLKHTSKPSSMENARCLRQNKA